MDDPNDPFGPPSPLIMGSPQPTTKLVEAAAAAASTSSKPFKVPPKKRARHKKSKKPKDMPRRPLSAYNIFFQEERSRLLREIENGNDVLEAEGKSQGLFALMGKSIAKKWKSLTQDEMVKYTDAAKEDLKRYRREMDEYQILVTQKCRIEEEQKSEELDQYEPAKAVSSVNSMGQLHHHHQLLPQQQQHVMDDPQAYGRLRELQLREASHQTDVSRLLAAGRPDLASQVMSAGFGGAAASAGMGGGHGHPGLTMFNQHHAMQPHQGGMPGAQQAAAGLMGDAAANKATMEFAQQLGLSGPQLMQFLHEDALRRQIERERQLQFEILLRQQQQQQQQFPGGGGAGGGGPGGMPTNDPAFNMLLQQQLQRTAGGGGMGGTMGGPGGFQNQQQLQQLLMMQQLQQQQQQMGQYGMGLHHQQQHQQQQLVQQQMGHQQQQLNQQQQQQQQQLQQMHMNQVGSHNIDNHSSNDAGADDEIGRPSDEIEHGVVVGDHHNDHANSGAEDEEEEASAGEEPDDHEFGTTDL